MTDVYYRLKRILKRGRLTLRRLIAALRWGWKPVAEAPPVFGNAMPKAGSHLLLQILYGLVDIGPFIKPGFPPINRFEDNSHLSEEEMVREIQRMESGEIRFGYLPYREPFVSLLTKNGMAVVFIYRDPRDLLVSHVFYALDIHEGHSMHEYYSRELSSMEQRLNVAIEGCQKPGLELPDVRERIQDNLGWLEDDHVLSVKFEDLIQNRDHTLGMILDYIQGFGVDFPLSRTAAVAALGRAIQPQKSGTFRKGQPGNWREHFTQENKEKFKDLAGDLLIELGYEQDHDW